MEPQLIQQSVRLEIKKPVYSITPKYVWGMTLIAWEIYKYFFFHYLSCLVYYTVLSWGCHIKTRKAKLTKTAKTGLTLLLLLLSLRLSLFLSVFLSLINWTKTALLLFYITKYFCFVNYFWTQINIYIHYLGLFLRKLFLIEKNVDGVSS